MPARRRRRTHPEMRNTEHVGIGWSVLRAVPAIFVVGVVTFICFTFRVGFETVSLCYLIVVVLQSLSGNFLSSAIVSVVSFLCLDYFFVPPFFSLRVSDASDTLALISFLTAGLVITRLTSRARKAADLEKLQREETTRLYKLAHELLVSKPDTAVGPDLLQQFKSEFNLRAVCFFDAGTTQLFFEGVSQDHLDEKTRAAYILQRDSEDETLGIAVRVLPGANGPAGAIGFEGLRDIELTAAPLAALAAVMMERAHVFRRASQAAAAAETEVFRGAVLDALAHEFKTPLATILTAAGGLREVGPLLPAQAELAQTVESGTSRLSQLTTRLLRLARLDREEVRPQMELTDLTDVVSSLVAQYSRRWPNRQFKLIGSVKVNVNGDRELLGLGLGQLLDNACKYSRPDSEITVSVECADESVTIRVWNSGAPIAASEQARIFDRFFRGVQASKLAAGSGLGLYVARKIAVAHGGSLFLDGPQESGGGTSFHFTIPISQSEPGQ